MMSTRRRGHSDENRTLCSHLKRHFSLTHFPVAIYPSLNKTVSELSSSKRLKCFHFTLCLNENRPPQAHMCKHLFPSKGCGGRLWGGGLIEEVGQWGSALRFPSPSLLPVFFLLPLLLLTPCILHRASLQINRRVLFLSGVNGHWDREGSI